MEYKIDEREININGEQKLIFVVINEHGIDLIKFTSKKQAEKFIEDMQKGGLSVLSDRIKYRS